MFVPLLTVVLSISVIIDTAPPSPEHSLSWDYLKQHAVGAVHAWTQKLPRKPRTELSTLQVRTLLLLARQLRLVSVDELWKESGSLVRSAMVMGLHVNVSQSKSLSPFQAECRRRLWASIVELDLQTSIAAGMPVMTPALDFSPLAPSNLNDIDFDESTELPPSRPMDEDTDSLAQITLVHSLALRIKTMNLVQHTSPEESMEERLQQGQQIEKSLQKIPAPLKFYDLENNDPAFVLNRVILDVYIRRPLISLYRPVLASHTHDDPSFLEIQRASLDSSIAILTHQEIFDPNIIDLDIRNINSYWNMFQTFCQNDIILAALTVCEYLKFINQQTTLHSSFNDSSFENNNNNQRNQNKVFSPYTTNGNPNNHSLSHNKASLTRLVEITIDSLTRRIGEKGTNMKDILLLSVVLQSVRGRGPAEQKDRRMEHGAKKALSACRQTLLSAANENIFPFHLNGADTLSNYEVYLTP